MDAEIAPVADPPSEGMPEGAALTPFVRQLRADIAGDVLEIVAGTWALHGTIPVDGNVLLAEFGSYDEARRALDVISASQDASHHLG